MLVGHGSKNRGSSFQEGALHTHTLRLSWSRISILCKKKKKKKKKLKNKKFKVRLKDHFNQNEQNLQFKST